MTFTYKDGTKRHWVTMPKSIPDVVKTLSDSKGKGVYDQSKVVFEGELPSNVLLYDGWLYVAGEGTVRRYKQSKTDGPYDVKEVVAQGFRDPAQYRPVCGMTIGPDGRLYLSTGEGDHVVEGSDGSRATVLRTGAVFRCRPDGSKMEVYALGFMDSGRGASFDAAGNLFHTDDGAGEMGSKFAGCRLMHVVEGADFGWRGLAGRSYVPDTIRTATAGDAPGKLPPMLTTGHGSAGGLLIFNDGRFPENWQGLILASDAARQTIHAYKAERKGATFEVVQEFDFLKSDDPQFRPRQVVLGPDGAVYVVDSRDRKHGRIYRLTWAGTKDQPALPPRPMDSWAKIAKLGDDDLVKALLSDDAGDREHAQRELARRGEKERPALLKILKDAEQADAARVAALGALESMWDGDVQAAALFVMQKDSSADVRRFAADAVGLNAASGDDDVQNGLLRALNDVAPEVRRSVALAMSRVGAAAAPDNLVNAWAFEENPDPYLCDGLVRAIENLGKSGIDRLVALGESGVKTETDKVVEAFTMMRTRPAAEAVPRVLENPHLTAAQRAALLRSYANYLLDPPASLAPAVDYLMAHPQEDAAVKAAGLKVLALDGLVRGDKAEAWAEPLIEDKDVGVRLAAAWAVAAMMPARAAPLLKGMLAEDKANGPEADALRVAAFRALAALDAPTAQALARSYVDKKDPMMLMDAIGVLAGDAEGARFLGRAAADKKLPPEVLPLMTGALRRYADRDPECARLLKELGGKE